jgi:hypothetical protein
VAPGYDLWWDAWDDTDDAEWELLLRTPARGSRQKKGPRARPKANARRS